MPEPLLVWTGVRVSGGAAAGGAGRWRPRFGVEAAGVTEAGLHVFMNERVGDGVVMAVKLEVVVEADASADLPVAVDEGLGGEWPKCGLVQSLEELAATGPVEPHQPGIEIREELGDPRVEGGEGEEGLVSEAGRGATCPGL